MSRSKQLALGPMPLQKVANAVATNGNSIDIGAVAIRAFGRAGMNSQQAASALGMSPSQFTKAFSSNWPQHNPVMKRLGAPNVRAFLREFVLLLAEDCGISFETEERLALSEALIATAKFVALKR